VRTSSQELTRNGGRHGCKGQLRLPAESARGSIKNIPQDQQEATFHSRRFSQTIGCTPFGSATRATLYGRAVCRVRRKGLIIPCQRSLRALELFTLVCVSGSSLPVLSRYQPYLRNPMLRKSEKSLRSSHFRTWIKPRFVQRLGAR